jgi:hypothetical protein
MADKKTDREAISVETLKALVSYDAKTNRFFWKERPAHLFASRRIAKVWNTRFAGKEAFKSKMQKGYYYARIWTRCYLKHRAIWAFVHGKWPVHNIDHINGDPSDNRIENLRDVPQTHNMRNTTLSRRNTSGAVGVRWYARKRRWTAAIKVNRKHHHLGSFLTFAEALDARKAAERQHGFLPGHGRSAA